MRPGVPRLGAAILLAALAAGGGARAADEPVIAQRGAIALTTVDIRGMLQSADPDTRRQLAADPAALAQFVRGVVVQHALLQEAHARQWDQKPDVIARANAVRDAEIVRSFLAAQTVPDASYPSDADVQSAYEANKTRFMLPRQYHLAQIFLALPQDAAPKAVEDARRRVLDLRQQAVRGRPDFAEFARRQSEDHASAARGGDLGWVAEDRVVAPVKAAVAGLEVGGISDPVRMADGFHLVKLLGTRPAAPAALAQVRDSLIRALRSQRQTANEQAYIGTMLRASPVQLDEIQLSRLATP